MARPHKTGLDYFPHDTDASTELSLKFLQAVHGITAYAVYFKILEMIFRQGYYIHWTERNFILFSNDDNIEVNVCRNIINDCINEGLFNQKLYDKFQVLTSVNIQAIYLKSCERRKQVYVNKNYVLVNINTMRKELMSTITLVNDDKNPQSKVKKSKVENSRIKGEEKNSNCSSNIPPFIPPNEIEKKDFENKKSRDSTTSSSCNPQNGDNEKRKKVAQKKEKIQIESADSNIQSGTIDQCKSFYLNIATGYYWEEKDSRNLKELLIKLKTGLHENHTDKDLLQCFQIFMANLPKYWRTKKFTIPLINLNYNEIINEINTKNAGESKQHTSQTGKSLSEQITGLARRFARRD